MAEKRQAGWQLPGKQHVASYWQLQGAQGLPCPFHAHPLCQLQPATGEAQCQKPHVAEVLCWALLMAWRVQRNLALLVEMHLCLPQAANPPWPSQLQVMRHLQPVLRIFAGQLSAFCLRQFAVHQVGRGHPCGGLL